MATGPNERRAKADATSREAKAQIEAQTAATRQKTARLREERLAREATDGRATPAETTSQPSGPKKKKS